MFAGESEAGAVVNERSATIVLALCCFSLFMAQLDATAVNVALPSIGHGLGGGLSSLQWVVDAYVLVLGSLALSGGTAGDRYGRRRIYRAGLLVFGLGSLACSLSTSLTSLVVCRMVQGVGAAMIMPTTLAIIVQTFPDPRRRARAIGVWAGSAGLAAAAGPVLGGALTTAIGWRSIFWINLPVGAVALFLTGRHIEESRHPGPRRLDVGGQVLVAASFALLAYALIEAPGRGWTSASTLGLFAASALTILGFLLVEARTAEPLLDPRLLRNRSFSGATVIAVLLYLTLIGFLFLNTLYLQQVRGLSALAAGAAMLPCSLALAVGGPLGGRLVGRYGARPVLLAGSLLIAAAMVPLAVASPTTGFALLGGSYLFAGAGWGLINPPLTNAAVVAMPGEQAGIASATVGVSRQIGAILGVALMGSLTATRAHRLLGGSDGVLASVANAHRRLGPAPQWIFTRATHTSYALAVASALAATVIAWISMRRHAELEPAHSVPSDDRSSSDRPTGERARWAA